MITKDGRAVVVEEVEAKIKLMLLVDSCKFDYNGGSTYLFLILFLAGKNFSYETIGDICYKLNSFFWHLFFILLLAVLSLCLVVETSAGKRKIEIWQYI